MVKLTLLVLLSSGVYQFYPMLFYMREAWYLFLLIYCFTVVLFKHSGERGLVYSKFEWYVFCVMIFIPVLSAYSAWLAFGQPFFYGLATQRVMLLYCASLILLYLARSGRVSSFQLEKVMVGLGWYCIISYSIMNMVLNPAVFAGARGFVTGGVVEPYQFIFKSIFIVFNAIYYCLKGLSGKGALNFLLMLFFILFLVFIDGGRSQIVALSFTLFFAIVKVVRVKRLVILALPAFLVVSGLLFAIYSFIPEKVQYQVNNMKQAVSVVMTAEVSSDSSANARIKEARLAMPYVKENPMLGNGMLSMQWEDGYASKMGRFAPSDIGIIGLLFVHGVLGTILIYAQFIFAYTFTRKLAPFQRTVFMQAVSYLLVQIFIDSLATGRVVFSGCVSFMLIAMLYIPRIERNRLIMKSSRVSTR